MLAFGAIGDSQGKRWHSIATSIVLVIAVVLIIVIVAWFISGVARGIAVVLRSLHRDSERVLQLFGLQQDGNTKEMGHTFSFCFLAPR